MALLKLNGVDVECTASEWEPVTLGEVTRSMNGWPRDTGRVHKRDYRFTTSRLTVSEAEAVCGLVEGAGHVLTFDDATPGGYLYTSREQPPVSSSFVSRGTGDGRWGAGYLRVTAGVQVGWDLGDALGAGAFGTVVAWVRVGGGGSPWRHVVWAPGDQALYLDGVLAGDEYYWAFYGDRYLALGDLDGAGYPSDFDDVVALPYTVPAAWVPQVYTYHRNQSWTALPYVRATGPRFPFAGSLVLGKASTSTTLPALASIAESFDFTLHTA